MFKSEEAIWSSSDYNHLLMAPAPNGGEHRTRAAWSVTSLHVNCMAALVAQFELFSLSFAPPMQPIKRDNSKLINQMG
jgi:hypothetical protein